MQMNDAGGNDSMSLANARRSRKTPSPKQAVVQNHLASALENPDPLAAAMGVVNNNLLRTYFQYSATLRDAVSHSERSLATLEMLRPYFEVELRLQRGLQRNFAAELRAREQAEKLNLDTHRRISESATDPTGKAAPPVSVNSATVASATYSAGPGTSPMDGESEAKKPKSSLSEPAIPSPTALSGLAVL